MEKRIFTLAFVVILGVALGVGIVSHQAKDPFLRKLMEQQSEILNTQKIMIERLEPNQIAVQPQGDATQITQILQRQQILEQRIATMESKLQVLQQAQAAPQPIPQGPPPEDYTTVHEMPVAHSPVIGNKKAPVTIVEFVDFQCPFCARFHTPVVEAAAAYPGKVNYIIKNFPLSFHSQAKPAAKAAFAAGEQGKYSEMADVLLENGNNLSEETFEKLAKDLGLNVKKFLADYKEKDAQWERYIQEDTALGSRVGVRGTPTFYINGRKTNARDLNAWKREIDKILKK